METNVTWNHLSPSKQRLYTLQILVFLSSMARQPQRMRALHPSASRPTLALIGTDHTRRLPPMQQRYLHSRSTHRLRLRRLYQSQAFPFLSSARQRRHLHRQTASTLRSPATVPASRRRGVFHPAANHAITVGCACAQPDVTVVTQSLSAGPPERRPESPPAPPVHTPRI